MLQSYSVFISHSVAYSVWGSEAFSSSGVIVLPGRMLCSTRSQSVSRQSAKPVFGNDLGPRRLLRRSILASLSPGRYFGLTAAFASGGFGVIMIPMLFTATSVGVIAFIAVLSVDIDGIREPVSGSLIYGNNIIRGSQEVTTTLCTRPPRTLSMGVDPVRPMTVTWYLEAE